MQLSILIPTLESRRAEFERIYGKLRGQIDAHELGAQVEIVVARDNREHSVGMKRNALIEQARGEFAAFVDDDDDVSAEYVMSIYRAITEHPDIDCVGIKGIIYFNGTHPRVFIHSLQYREYFSQGGVYYRPPYHLNPIRRQLACRYPFADVSYSEDIDWAIRLSHDAVLQREYMLNEVLYIYYSRRAWRYQQLVDWSEPVRHALGLQLANRLRVQRWLQVRLGRAA